MHGPASECSPCSVLGKSNLEPDEISAHKMVLQQASRFKANKPRSIHSPRAGVVGKSNLLSMLMNYNVHMAKAACEKVVLCCQMAG